MSHSGQRYDASEVAQPEHDAQYDLTRFPRIGLSVIGPNGGVRAGIELQ